MRVAPGKWRDWLDFQLLAPTDRSIEIILIKMKAKTSSATRQSFCPIEM
ncbi:hypothetical protein PROFUN_15567 [Planoprotostelium fungivorum]|uniref:Uncharacterized protein n=1 Tax=Planoprotostelium fungivorum TaxID=1890364 RepID=A0A2P6MZ40_9EUKA|nr:hypothetical protein PROFUN_15567 [Planoprotostelium fungivorum]